MKKVIFIIALFSSFFLASVFLFAKTDTEYEKAIKYYNIGKYKEAIDIFKEYIKTKPEAFAYYYIGYALYKIREYDEAMDYFQQAYLIDPSFSPGTITPIQKGIGNAE
jgi:tetratricopeptide (TPR) repeat protein